MLNQNKKDLIFFYLLVLILPTQLGKHFWPQFSFINGLRIDYLSPTLYLTDIVILLIFISSLKKLLVKIKKKYFSVFLLFIFLLLTGTLISKNPGAGFYGLIKFLEFSFLFVYISLRKSEIRESLIVFLMSLSVIYESLISIFQYFNGGSLNGIFYFFGERFYNAQTPGIANVSISGELFLRPYGTFSHPNVLAAFLVLYMSVIMFFLLRKAKGFLKVFLIATIILGTTSLLFTFSRTGILSWVLVLFLSFANAFLKKYKNFTRNFSLFVLLFISLLMIFYFPLSQRIFNFNLTDQSITQREALINESFKMISNYPLLGVGVNNFLNNLHNNSLPYLLQPVHNIYLLVFAETGILGFLFLIFFIFILLKKIYIHHSFESLVILLVILLMSSFDHYFLTIQQGQILFAFFLGLIYSGVVVLKN